MKIFYLGPLTFSEDAAEEYCSNHPGILVSLPSFRDVVETLVVCKKDDVAVLPSYNTLLECNIEEPQQLIEEYDLDTIDKILVPVHFSLAQRQKNEDTSRIYVMPVSKEQCSHYLTKHHSQLKIIPVKSNGEAASRAVREGGLAVTGWRAVDFYDLDVLVEGIANNKGYENFTEFSIVKRK